MRAYLIAANPGSGKTTLAAELRRRELLAPRRAVVLAQGLRPMPA